MNTIVAEQSHMPWQEIQHLKAATMGHHQKLAGHFHAACSLIGINKHPMPAPSVFLWH